MHYVLLEFDKARNLTRYRVRHGGHLTTTQPTNIDDAIGG
jgi:hypothetical protein